jgi:hypothetical protein
MVFIISEPLVDIAMQRFSKIVKLRKIISGIHSGFNAFKSPKKIG